MPRPRRETVSSTKKGVYHIRCEFTQGFHFLGQDPICKSFCGYRRQWVIDKCNHLCRTFPVNILSMTVRTGGYDMVLRFDPTQPRKWSEREVVEHWSSYFVKIGLTKITHHRLMDDRGVVKADWPSQAGWLAS